MCQIFLFIYTFLILGLPEQDNLVKDLKNKLRQETQENAKLTTEMSKKDTMINQLKEKLQIADCQRYILINFKNQFCTLKFRREKSNFTKFLYFVKLQFYEILLPKKLVTSVGSVERFSDRIFPFPPIFGPYLMIFFKISQHLRCEK